MWSITKLNTFLLLSATLLFFSGNARSVSEQSQEYCGEKYIDKNNFYRFESFRNNIALMPNDGSNIGAYEAIYSIYEYKLKSEGPQTTVDMDILQLLEEIVSGLTSANLSLVESENTFVEVYAGEQLALVINCDFIKENRDTFTDIVYILSSIKTIYQEGWSNLSKDVLKTTKLRSVRYDQWLRNGVRRTNIEQILYKGLGFDTRLRIDPSVTKSQYTMLRPHLGLAGSDYKGTYKLALAIDLVGIINYTSANYSSHWGLSLAGVIRENEKGYFGVMYRQNDYIIGYTRNVDDDSDGIFVGIDLFQLLEGNRPNNISFRVEEASSYSE